MTTTTRHDLAVAAAAQNLHAARTRMEDAIRAASDSGLTYRAISQLTTVDSAPLLSHQGCFEYAKKSRTRSPNMA